MTKVFLYCNASNEQTLEMNMNTATITPAHTGGPRHQLAAVFGRIRTFAIALYTAHGGWFVTDAAQPASGALARTAQRKLASSN